eukprot:15450089-Alexandrium_andersonii.AAC.1
MTPAVAGAFSTNATTRRRLTRSAGGRGTRISHRWSITEAIIVALAGRRGRSRDDRARESAR